MQKNIWKTTKSPILSLAPMAGYTDSAFRILCQKNGADIVYTEMVSVEAIWRKNKKTLEMLKLLPHPSKNCSAINGAREKNVILQLFGSKPESFEKALKLIKRLNCHPGESQDPGAKKNSGSRVKHGMTKRVHGMTKRVHWMTKRVRGMTKIRGIDINFGCPAKKVYKTGAGAALMNNKKLAREIIQTVLANTNLPVSIKIRSQVKNVTAVEFINYIKDLPISAVMIHGRSLKQSFSGPIDYEMIKKVKKLLPNIPVLANGGINTPRDAKIMLDKTGADGLGIGRGSWGRPWIFSSLSRALNKDGKRDVPSFSRRGGSSEARDGVVNKPWSQIKKIILQHSKLFIKYSSNLIPLRKHLLHYTKGQKNASQLRQKIIKIKTLYDLKKI